jgi:hypothetical protein
MFSIHYAVLTNLIYELDKTCVGVFTIQYFITALFVVPKISFKISDYY